MYKRMLALLAVGCVLWRWQFGRRTLVTNSVVKPVEVATWESEGGALRGTGAQLGPDPVLPSHPITSSTEHSPRMNS